MENSIKKSSQTIWRMDWPEVGGGGDKRTKCGHNEMPLGSKGCSNEGVAVCLLLSVYHYSTLLISFVLFPHASK